MSMTMNIHHANCLDEFSIYISYILNILSEINLLFVTLTRKSNTYEAAQLGA